MKNIILIGAGGHCESCIDIIENSSKYKVVGLVDKIINKTVHKYKYLGNDTLLLELKKKYNYAFVTLGEYKNLKIRLSIYQKLIKLKYILPVLISKTANVSKKIDIKDGTIIMNSSTVCSGVEIGYNTIVNTGVIIDHNSKIYNNCNISPGVIINGNVKIGNNTFIGSGSIIKEGVKIGDNCFIRMGSIVKKNISRNKKF